MPAVEQLAVLVAAMEGWFDGLSEASTMSVMAQMRADVSRDLADVAVQLAQNVPLSDQDRARMSALGSKARRQLEGEYGPDA